MTDLHGKILEAPVQFSSFSYSYTAYFGGDLLKPILQDQGRHSNLKGHLHRAKANMKVDFFFDLCFCLT